MEDYRPADSQCYTEFPMDYWLVKLLTRVSSYATLHVDSGQSKEFQRF